MAEKVLTVELRIEIKIIPSDGETIVKFASIKSGNGTTVRTRKTRKTHKTPTIPDKLAGFIADRVIVDDGARVPTGELYEAYLSWCEQNGEKPVPSNIVGKMLTQRGIEAGKKNSVRVREGIRLRESPPVDHDV